MQFAMTVGCVMLNGADEPPLALPVKVDVSCVDVTTISAGPVGSAELELPRGMKPVPPYMPPLTVLWIAPFVIAPLGV